MAEKPDRRDLSAYKLSAPKDEQARYVRKALYITPEHDQALKGHYKKTKESASEVARRALAYFFSQEGEAHTAEPGELQGAIQKTLYLEREQETALREYYMRTGVRHSAILRAALDMLFELEGIGTEE